MTKYIKLFIPLIFAVQIATAANASPGYFRQPSLHQDTLVFTAEGDIWRKNINAETAVRLTTHPALEHSAVISPNGNQVAFAANYEGATEIYVMPITGGLAKRITYENSNLKLHEWHASGLVYATNSRVGPTGSWVLKQVDPSTLNTQTIPLSDAVEGRFDSSGNTLFFTQFGLQVSTDNANQYNGGAKGEIWRFRMGNKRHSDKEAMKLTSEHPGSVREPMVSNNLIFFVSNASGLDNIWSMTTDGKDLQQITKFEDWAVRDAMLNRNTIVFQHGADIKLLDLSNNRITTQTIKLTSDFPNLRENWVNKPLTYLNAARYTAEQSKVTLTARGRIAVTGTTTERLIEIATDPTSRSRNAILSNDGKWVYALNDSSGEMEIWQFAADGSKQAKQLTSDGNIHRWNIYPSPSGDFIAHDDKNGNLWLLELASGENTLILNDNSGISPVASLAWSADSQMLAITHNKRGNERSAVLLYSLNEKKKQIVTSDKYESYSPTFSADGKWLYFLSNRHFVATPGAPWGDRNMGPMFDRRTQIFALSLTSDASFAFQPVNELNVSDEDKQTDSAESKDNDEEEDKESSPAIAIEWDGLQDRLWQVPIASGNYSNLAMNDKFLFVIDRVQEPKRKQGLKSIAIKPKTKIETFVYGIADYQLSTDGKTLFVRKDDNGNSNQFIVPAGAKFPKNTTEKKLQTSQWKLAIQPQQEWQQIFKDAWLMHRDSLFDANMRGLDWKATKAKYSPLLARVTDRHELNDIFEQMMGELNVLHSQVRGGDMPKDTNAPRAASLGGVFKDAKSGVEITHIYRHDPELPRDASPLNKPGVDARIGDVITHVNAQPITNVAGLVRALRNQAGSQVLLDLQRAEEELKTVVEPVSASRDFRLRYQDWVVGNASNVTEANSDIGYLHLYAMGGNDVATFAKEFYAQYKKPGLIIDVRRNRGGNVDAWILEKLLKRTWMFWQTTKGEHWANMQQTFRGHLVVLADEFTYSDGETFTAGIKALEIGPVIGKQTAGAGVWLSGRNRVVDNGIARVAEYPVYALDGRWIVEGTGVKPDIEVHNLPHATFRGEDAQLNAAIKYLEEKLREEPISDYQAKPLPKSTAPADYLR